ncbi:CCR4-NOT core subunit cdc39 [Spiromyces aspiralis]|uniref:CCR4-NOT core subunit cdc39 n=1 Tax=Spiromyces aspiralis TaxID=68401 RepID=A0ACC1HAP4_9FUNG|nr:CCR4-NOT core subunit cdc39 [Spiromyces aspiralis]
MLALQLLSQVNLSDSDTVCTFFMVCVDTAIEFYEKAITQELHSSCHQVTDAVTKLLIYLLRYDIAAQSTDTTNSDAQAVATKRKPESQKTLLAIYLCLATLLLARDHAVHTATFPSRQNAYFRIFGAYLFEFHRAYKAGELSSAVYYHALLVFAQALDMIQPLGTPGFSYAWLALLSHRHFFPKLLTSKEGWPLAEKLVVAQLRFLEPFIYLNDITEAVRFMYGYTVRFLLITLHDFPEFLADHAVALCNATPVTCVQLRNLFLSAYSRDTVLPDPVAVSREQKPMPPMDSPPMIATDYLSVIEKAGIVGPLNAYLDDGNTESVAEVTEHLINAFSSPQFAIKVGSTSAAPGAPQTTRVGPRYSMALINSVVVHLGACVSENHELVPEMRKLIYQLLTVLDAEGRYLVLTAIANQLRFPSSFTIIFSRELLWLFTNPPVDRICEQIIRVLVERVLANRPLPWGLLFTLSELVRDPAYDAWAQKLSEETPQIQEILNSVAERVKRPFSAGAPSVSAAA